MVENQSQNPALKRRFVWPWIVAIAVLIGIVLAVVSVRREAQRIQNQRQFEIPHETR